MEFFCEMFGNIFTGIFTPFFLWEKYVTNFIFFSDLDQSFDDDCDGKLVIAEGDDLDIKPDDLDRKECLQHFYSLPPHTAGVLLPRPNFAPHSRYWCLYPFDIFGTGTGSRKLHN